MCRCVHDYLRYFINLGIVDHNENSVYKCMIKIPSTLLETEGRHIGDDSFLFITIQVNKYGITKLNYNY